MSENELDPIANTLTRIYPKGTIPECFIWVPVQVSSGFPEAFGNDIRLEILKWVNAASWRIKPAEIEYRAVQHASAGFKRTDA